MKKIDINKKMFNKKNITSQTLKNTSTIFYDKNNTRRPKRKPSLLLIIKNAMQIENKWHIIHSTLYIVHYITRYTRKHNQ